MESSPETIECRHQNRPMSQIGENVDLKKFPNDVDENSKFVHFDLFDWTDCFNGHLLFTNLQPC